MDREEDIKYRGGGGAGRGRRGVEPYPLGRPSPRIAATLRITSLVTKKGEFSAKVFVDGVPLDEPYTHGQPSLPGDPRIVYPVKLPAGTLWVMGDNRTQSKDSRWLGPVPVSSVHGKAFVIYWPPSRWGLLE